jgi:hypothetical protein
MASSLDDDSTPANARVWDFAMPPKSCWTLPLSSENPAVAERLSITVMALCNARFGVVAAMSAAESQPRFHFVGGHRRRYALGDLFLPSDSLLK